jgi:hypothetical protein
MKMIERTLRLTWRKGLQMAAVWAVLMLARLVVDVVLHSGEPFLTLAAGLLVPMWAISAAVYTWANSEIAPGRGWREGKPTR